MDLSIEIGTHLVLLSVQLRISMCRPRGKYQAREGALRYARQRALYVQPVRGCSTVRPPEGAALYPPPVRRCFTYRPSEGPEYRPSDGALDTARQRALCTACQRAMPTTSQRALYASPIRWHSTHRPLDGALRIAHKMALYPPPVRWRSTYCP